MAFRRIWSAPGDRTPGDAIRPPGLFALYIAVYSFGRFWIELVRVDPVARDR